MFAYVSGTAERTAIELVAGRWEGKEKASLGGSEHVSAAGSTDVVLLCRLARRGTVAVVLCSVCRLWRVGRPKTKPLAAAAMAEPVPTSCESGGRVSPQPNQANGKT